MLNLGIFLGGILVTVKDKEQLILVLLEYLILSIQLCLDQLVHLLDPSHFLGHNYFTFDNQCLPLKQHLLTRDLDE